MTPPVTQPDLVLPDGCVDIVFSPSTGLRVVGAMTACQVYQLQGGEPVVGIRFRPGAAGRFLGAAPSELTDRLIPLEDIWGARGRRLAEALRDTRSAAACAALLEGEMRPAPRDAGALERAIAALVEACGAADIDWLADQANLSPRQFRRRCHEATGLTPKQLARVLRFRRAVSLVDFGAARGWAHLAAECGYYDQSHLIHDFREFSGSTPADYHVRFFQSRSGAAA